MAPSQPYPDVKLAYWVGGNPFHSTIRTGTAMVKAWQKLDTFIVQDFQWTPDGSSCRYRAAGNNRL